MQRSSYMIENQKETRVGEQESIQKSKSLKMQKKSTLSYSQQLEKKVQSIYFHHPQKKAARADGSLLQLRFFFSCKQISTLDQSQGSQIRGIDREIRSKRHQHHSNYYYPVPGENNGILLLSCDAMIESLSSLLAKIQSTKTIQILKYVCL